MTTTTTTTLTDCDLTWARDTVRLPAPPVAKDHLRRTIAVGLCERAWLDQMRRAVAILRRDGGWLDHQTADQIDALLPPQTLREEVISDWHEVGPARFLVGAGAAFTAGLLFFPAMRLMMASLDWIAAVVAAAGGGV